VPRFISATIHLGDDSLHLGVRALREPREDLVPEIVAVLMRRVVEDAGVATSVRIFAVVNMKAEMIAVVDVDVDFNFARHVGMSRGVHPIPLCHQFSSRIALSDEIHERVRSFRYTPAAGAITAPVMRERAHSARTEAVRI